MTQKARGRLIAAIMLIAWDLVALGLGFHILRKGQFVEAAGWFVLVAFFLVVTWLFFLPASPSRHVENVSLPKAPINSSAVTGNLVEIMRSNDQVRIEIVKAKLVAKGISVEIIGEHSSRMLGFLPGVPSRLMVPQIELERCLQILYENDDKRADPEGRL